MDVLLGAGGVASGTAEWYSGRCLEYESSQGGSVLRRRNDLENSRVIL